MVAIIIKEAMTIKYYYREIIKMLRIILGNLRNGCTTCRPRVGPLI